MNLKNLVFVIIMICIYSCKDHIASNIISIDLTSNNSHKQMRIDFYDMKYLSDGLEIQGYIHKPAKEGKFPVVIYNRGGNRNLGTHNVDRMEFQEEMAMTGYVVLSTQLRGNKFSEGKDEMGGKDLNDIMKLIDIVDDLEYADGQNIGVYGISRGGMNTYQVSRETDRIKCIAVVGAPVDPRIDFDTRPEMYDKVFFPLVGDTIAEKEKYDFRSPIKWVKEINEPTLILHGLDDKRVTPENAELMIEAMEENGNVFDFKLFKEGNHSLSSHVGERNKLVIDWFNKHLRDK